MFPPRASKDVLTGTALSPTAIYDTKTGAVSLQFSTGGSIVWGSGIVWGSNTLQSNGIVWGSACDANETDSLSLNGEN